MAEVSSHVRESFLLSPERALECEEPVRGVYRSLGLAVDSLLDMVLDSARQVSRGPFRPCARRLCTPRLTDGAGGVWQVSTLEGGPSALGTGVSPSPRGQRAPSRAGRLGSGRDSDPPPPSPPAMLLLHRLA